MASTNIKQAALIKLLVSLACASAFGQEIAPTTESPRAGVPYDNPSAVDASYIIFSNLDSAPDDRYNSDPNDPATTVAGMSAGGGQPESWAALRFVPEGDVQARVLMAAIGYVSGKKLVNLGIYSNDDILDTVGTLLPGGQASTREIPDIGVCCQLAKVTLPGEGVTLTGGTKYWLVATPDNIKARTFNSVWQASNAGATAYLSPPLPWHPDGSRWVAAQIRGTRMQTFGPAKPANRKVTSPQTSDPASQVTIFTNLNRTSTDLYRAVGGASVSGNLYSGGEAWEALPFTPTANVHATTLAAAIGWFSGTKKVNLGIYSDDAGIVGTLLPGGQGSTIDIPDYGDCCELAKVRLLAGGVALTAGIQYWLVASPDNVDAPDFRGIWQPSDLAVVASQQPEFFTGWITFGGWFAAEIRGTDP